MCVCIYYGEKSTNRLTFRLLLIYSWSLAFFFTLLTLVINYGVSKYAQNCRRLLYIFIIADVYTLDL